MVYFPPRRPLVPQSSGLPLAPKPREKVDVNTVQSPPKLQPTVLSRLYLPGYDMPASIQGPAISKAKLDASLGSVKEKTQSGTIYWTTGAITSKADDDATYYQIPDGKGGFVEYAFAKDGRRLK
jgi:hypothetical protein